MTPPGIWNSVVVSGRLADPLSNSWFPKSALAFLLFTRIRHRLTLLLLTVPLLTPGGRVQVMIGVESLPMICTFCANGSAFVPSPTSAGATLSMVAVSVSPSK